MSESTERLRTKDFKIGVLHGGKPVAKKSGSECGLQRHLFHSQALTIVRGSKSPRGNSLIRLIAYEMPLGHGRDWCVDLVGYDQNHDLYLIEIKVKGTKDTPEKIVKQINRYYTQLNKPEVMNGIENEFKKMYHLTVGFKFREVRKVILCEKTYFQLFRGIVGEEVGDIEFLYFGSSKILKDPTHGVKLHVWNWKRRNLSI